MSLSISFNMSAIRTANSLQSHYSSLQKSIARLSSGTKLLSSEDDPTKMATHNIYEGKIAVFNKGIENIREGVSMMQTAESTIEEIGERLIRMKEIAEQVSTGTYTNEQRMILQSEFSTMGIEIDRLATFSDFKGIKMLNGSLSARNDISRSGSWYQASREKLNTDTVNPDSIGLKVHFGDRNSRLEDYYFFRIEDLRMKGLLRGYKSDLSASNKIAVSTQHSAQLALDAINTALARQNKNRIYTGIFQNRLNASLQHLEEYTYNLQDTDRKIMDVDFAEEMTRFTSLQMMSDAATTMLTQANLLPKIALKLLGN